MSTNKDGGSAFPIGFNEGMTLRQWYAGLAMQGILANPDTKYSNWEVAEIAFNVTEHMFNKFVGDNK